MQVIKIDYDIPGSYYEKAPEGFNPIFALGGIVLAERFSGKGYIYKAINIDSGQARHLYHSKNRLAVAKHEEVAARVCSCGLDAKAAYITVKSVKDCLVGQLKLIFTHIMPRYGYTMREQQIELAEHMLQTICSRGISISEAGVGSGKTHAYILAALLARQSARHNMPQHGTSRDLTLTAARPIIISTSSIALQKAVVEDYIPEISMMLTDYGILSKPLSCVVRKGKEHYICDMRLKRYISTADEKVAATLRSLFDRHFLNIDLDEMEQIGPAVKKKICVNGQCNPGCGRYGTCRYLKFLGYAKSNEHDIQVCNHNYLLADTLRRNQGGQPLLPDYQCLIFDEAHKFLQAARQMYGADFSSMEVPRLAKYINYFSYTDKTTKLRLGSYADSLMGANAMLFKLLVKGIPAGNDYSDDTERFKTEIGRQAKAAIKSLLYNLTELRELLSRTRGVRVSDEHLYAYVMWALKDTARRLEFFGKPQDTIYWLEISKLTFHDTKEISLIGIPKDLSGVLAVDLWSKPIPILLTSGTLSVAGSFDHIKGSLGLDLAEQGRLREISKSSPFDYPANCLLYISKKVPFPDNRSREYIAAVADEVWRLIQAAHGHTAVLFTSYKVMELVFQIINNKNSVYPLIRLDRGGINSINRFRDSSNGVLFASGSMWEGIDLPGDILSLLIIVKLPFPTPDPISDYEQSRYGNMDEYKQMVVFPEMILKLKQGFGRLIRQESDSGVVALLDYRARLGGAYHKRVLESLPACQVTGDIAEVAAFIRQKKKVEYFK